MSDKSINSLFGMLATKELPDSGILKTTNNSNQGNHESNSFHAKLVDSMKSTHTSNDQLSTTTIPAELNNMSDTDNINHIIKLLSMGPQTNLTVNNNDNQLPVNPEIKQNILANEFTNIVINSNSGGKTSTARLETNTLLENGLLNNQDFKPLDGTSNNLLRNAQKAMVEPSPEQLSLSFSDKSSTTQNNTKINAPILSETATGDTDNELALHLSKLQNLQTLLPQKGTGTSFLNLRSDIIKEQAKAPVTDNQNNLNTNGNAGPAPIPDAFKTINPNASSHTEQNVKDKILETLKGQHEEKASFDNSGKNSKAQQGLAQARIENDESSTIFDVNTNTTAIKTTKLFDNTALTNNNGVSVSEAAMPTNTSSENSFFNNQGADTLSEFQVGFANIKQSIEPEKNFANTLSQTSNSNKPLGALGNDVTDNIIQNAKSYTQGGKSEVKIQLNPPELGTLKLEFTFDDDILETKITVERSSVKDIIEKDIPRLRELISNADIDVGKLDVSLQDKENGRMDFMNKDFHSDSKSKSTQDFSNQENKYYDDNADNADEETMVNNMESTQINYLI